jgi:hypothetical protein
MWQLVMLGAVHTGRPHCSLEETRPTPKPSAHSVGRTPAQRPADLPGQRPAQRVHTPHGQGVVTGRSSDGTTSVMLDGGRILAVPNDLVDPVTPDHVIPQPRTTAVTPAGGAFLLSVYANEVHGWGPKMAFHGTASAARALVKSGHLRAVGGGAFVLSGTGSTWAAVYHIGASVAEKYRALLGDGDVLLSGPHTTEERMAHLGLVDARRAELVKAIRLLFKVNPKQADRAVSVLVRQGVSLAAAVRESRAAH